MLMSITKTSFVLVMGECDKKQGDGEIDQVEKRTR